MRTKRVTWSIPSPSLTRRKSTFIYSTNKKTSDQKIFSIIKKNFKISHGRLTFDRLINIFPITPHIKKFDKDLIFIGDSLRSIHPVAGQGWNLGIKDIQTLCKLTEQYSLDSKIFNSIYYSKRILESTLYLGFTSILNTVYENQNLFSKSIIRVGFEGLRNFKF